MSGRRLTVVEDLYHAISVGNLDDAARCFTADAQWQMPGNSRLAGTYKGRQAIKDEFLARFGPLSGHTFRAELIDVAEGAQYVIAVQRATGTQGSVQLEITGCQLISFEDERIKEVRGHYSDQYALDEFWGRVT